MMHDLQPGRAYGQLQLGAKLWGILRHLRSEPGMYGSDVAITWDEEVGQSPQIGNVIVTISAMTRGDHAQPSVRLIFAGSTQSLLLIEIVGDPCLRRTVWKGDRLLPSPSNSSALPKQTAFKLLNARFGPTYPPSPHPSYSDTEQILSYPGVVFAYPLDSKTAAGSSPTSASAASHLLSRIVISQHDPSVSTAAAFPDIAMLEKNICVDDPYLAQLSHLEIRIGIGDRPSYATLRHRGPLVDKFSIGDTAREATFTIGKSTTEDISADLGSATQTFYKTTDSAASTGTSSFDYFLNYFADGIDFLMHGPSHTLRKIIIHGNTPGEIQFGRYARCRWVIAGKGKAVTSEDKFPTVRNALRNQAGSNTSTLNKALSDRALLLDRTADSYTGVRLDRTTELHTLGSLVFEVTLDGSVETLWLS